MLFLMSLFPWRCPGHEAVHNHNIVLTRGFLLFYTVVLCSSARQGVRESQHVCWFSFEEPDPILRRSADDWALRSLIGRVQRCHSLNPHTEHESGDHTHIIYPFICSGFTSVRVFVCVPPGYFAPGQSWLSPARGRQLLFQTA